LDKKFTRTDPETGIRKIVSNKTKDIWPKTGMNLKHTKRNVKLRQGNTMMKEKIKTTRRSSLEIENLENMVV
jgi:hypothetical protein